MFDSETAAQFNAAVSKFAFTMTMMGISGHLANGDVDEALRQLKAMTPENLDRIAMILEVLPGLLNEVRKS